MSRRFFIGDKVKTKHGVGRVKRVVTWRDRILDVENDYEAEEFCARCKAECGIGFRDIWIELFVSVGSSVVVVQGKDVEVLEGRDNVVENKM